jgi:hypothetical protein
MFWIICNGMCGFEVRCNFDAGFEMGTMGSWTTNRQDLEHLWRVRLKKKEQAYCATAALYGRLLNEPSEEHSRESPEVAVSAARVAAAQTFEEYAGVLSGFTQGTVHGRVPEEPLTREVFGV